jgi:hypothetical protein
MANTESSNTWIIKASEAVCRHSSASAVNLLTNTNLKKKQTEYIGFGKSKNLEVESVRESVTSRTKRWNGAF